MAYDSPFPQGSAVAAGEAVVVATFLPRCANCHAPHPAARRPAEDRPDCPDCGHPVRQTKTLVTKARVCASIVWGRILMRIGQFIRWLSEKL